MLEHVSNKMCRVFAHRFNTFACGRWSVVSPVSCPGGPLNTTPHPLIVGADGHADLLGSKKQQTSAYLSSWSFSLTASRSRCHCMPPYASSILLTPEGWPGSSAQSCTAQPATLNETRYNTLEYARSRPETERGWKRSTWKAPFWCGFGCRDRAGLKDVFDQNDKLRKVITRVFECLEDGSAIWLTMEFFVGDLEVLRGLLRNLLSAHHCMGGGASGLKSHNI